MKQKLSLGSSTSILIGAVIAILALLRGPVQTVLLLATFALWGLWVVLTLLCPAWRANRSYRSREERAAKEQDAFSGKNLSGMLLCHVNYRVSDYLKRVYPDARWEWMMPNPKDGWIVEECCILGYLLMEHAVGTIATPKLFYAIDKAQEEMLACIADFVKVDFTSLMMEYNRNRRRAVTDCHHAEKFNAYASTIKGSGSWEIKTVYIRSMLDITIDDARG